MSAVASASATTLALENDIAPRRCGTCGHTARCGGLSWRIGVSDWSDRDACTYQCGCGDLQTLTRGTIVRRIREEQEDREGQW